MRFISAILALGIAISSTACSGNPEPLSDADLDKVVDRLETSGKLEAAITRVFQKKAMEMRKEQEAKEKETQAAFDAKARQARPVNSSDHILGNAKARYSLIVYSDLECPFCKRFAQTPELVAKNAGDNVNVVFRNYPLSFHNPASELEHSYAECVSEQAGSKGFFSFANELFSMTQSNGKSIPGGEPALIALAGRHGASNAAALKACLNGDAIKKKIQADIADGSKAGVSGTPSTIIRDNSTGESRFVSGALPMEEITKNLKEVMAKP